MRAEPLDFGSSEFGPHLTSVTSDPSDELPSRTAIVRGRVLFQVRTWYVDGSDVETQWSMCTNGAQTTPVVGAEPREVMPLVNYRGSEEAVLHEIHEVAGRRQSAKQVLKP